MKTLQYAEPRNNGVVPARFDADAFDRERQRAAAAGATLAEAYALIQQADAQRAEIEADIAQRRTRLAVAAPRRQAAPPEETPAPGAYERALEETIQRRIGAAGVQTDAARLAEREFIIEVVGQAIGEALEEVHKRIDQLEHDNLQLRGMLHEHDLAVRSLLPDPADEYAPRTPSVLARAGSRTLTERTANRSYPSDEAAPWFGQPYFTDGDT
jgi:hypothetical protein